MFSGYADLDLQSSLVDFKDWLFAPDRSPWIADTYERLTGDHDYSSNPENEPCYFPCCEPAPTDHVNLDAWIKQMSFSAIHTLELDWIDSTVSSRLFYRLLSLTNLSIHGADRCSTQSLQSYLEQPLQPLITLHLSNIQLPNNTFGPLITTLGSTHRNLSDLTLRAENTIVSPAELNRLASLLPNLTSLTLSHNRSLPLLPSSSRYSPEEEAAAAAAAATFSSLQQLKLHVPSPGDFYKTQQDTVFNASTLATQFRDLTSHHPANSTASTTSTAAVRNIPAPKLQELEVLIGPWSRRNENSMLGPPTDVMGRYVCTRQATGDDEKGGGGGAVVVECSGGVLSPWSRGGGALVEEGPCAREVLADDEDMDMYGGIDDFEIGDGTLEGESW
ncbi:uncharacterized protein HMPREF1541_07644 [Cyphellophora europaea CBS 101466]|uniref:Uncharacterized protein n=1 Tax=Cyphellophora europaea (strain CBS 101466) TaxID=1220924 RepID=W2RND8_CYPE1|nr:uncharacterized protein HMPREF1541_07644 [Cyphellophora europaea CBS 101466]ETN38021.1 hypothetical protein HMPREF1541_07644 [Cyphellophora europaea CBS 101466]